jgi:DtxR family transcriptional regulator, Mn-dependent transcriptional regulator
MGEPLSESIQHYLREIYKLNAEEGKVSVTALARRLDVSNPSASAMVKKLAALELAHHEPYRGVELTPAGERVALEVIRHHRLLELYLAETLGLDVADVHEEADRLEHALSEELEARIDKALGFPTHDPHGDPIPDADLNWPSQPRPPPAPAERSPAPRTARLAGRAILRARNESVLGVLSSSRALASLASEASGLRGARCRPAEEPPLERPEQLLPDKRLGVRVAAVLLEHPHVVLEDVVRRLQSVLQLEALEDVVVAPRLVARAELRVHGSSHGPERARLSLDPDDDLLLLAGVVDTGERALCETTSDGLPAHVARIRLVWGSWRICSVIHSRSCSPARRRRSASRRT